MRLRPRLQIGESLSGRAMVENRIMISESESDSFLLEDHRSALSQQGIKSILLVPVRRDDRPIGVLVVHSKGDRRLTQQDIELATAFADQAAIAVEKTHLLHESQQRGARLEALAALGRTVSATLDPRHVIDFVVKATVHLLKINLARLWLWDETAQVLRVSASAGDPDLVVTARQTSRPGEGMSGVAFAQRETVATDTPTTDPRFLERAWAVEKGIQAYAAVPLLVGERVVGVLGTARRAPGAFQEEELALLNSFAAQAAIAIENARLYEAQRMAAVELEATVEARTLELQHTNVELRQALHRAEEASRTKSQFLATMSHELRTPLNPIIGFSELLEDQQLGALNEKQRQYVSRVLTSARHLLTLINGVLDLAKVEAGSSALDLDPLHLPQALKTSCEGIRPQAAAKGIELHLNIESCPRTLVADAARIRQILDHLLSNAIKFTPSGGKVTLSARRVQGAQFMVQGPEATVHGDPGPVHEPSTMNHERHGDFVEISVTDTGIGMKAEDLPKLFKPFTQLDASLTRKHQGTGLGLALTKKLVELHGGIIQAESGGSGQGSTFTVTLPLEGPAGDQVEPQIHQSGTSALPAA